jgi:type II secretory pathway pseudopilin PulG
MRRPAFQTDYRRGVRQVDGFTLVELLVAIGVVTLLLVLFLQLLSATTTTITRSNKQLDASSFARIALDRFGNDWSGAILTNGATALYYTSPGSSGNSALAFVTASRARGPTSSATGWTTDTRSAYVGYKVTPFSQSVPGSSTQQPLPSLGRADGRFTFSTQAIGSKATYNLWDLFGTGNNRIPWDLSNVPPTTGARTDEACMNWQLLVNGVFRLHISFVLDDGSVVQTPPGYRNFFVNGGSSAPCTPIAFSSTFSADPNRRYVKGIIVGLAVLDEKTRNLAYLSDNNFVSTINGQILRPTLDGETPELTWNRNLASVTFQPARQNLRFFQRFFAVNL